MEAVILSTIYLIGLCAPIKTENVNVKVFNRLSIKTESKTLIKHISCDCRCRLHCAKCNSKQK